MKKFLLAVSIAAITVLSAQAEDMKVYKSPSCGCCGKWGEAMKQSGFSSTEIKTDELMQVKAQFKVPDELASCHTAVVDGYVIEGHVPPAEVKRLLELKPADVIGIAVPGMPMESVGMKQGGEPEKYDVILFKKDGSQEVFATYLGDKKLK